jgi:hypothetical protein
MGGGSRAKGRRIHFSSDPFMPRSLVALIAVLVLLIAGIVFLSTRSTEKEPTRIEKVVPLDNLTN